MIIINSSSGDGPNMFDTVVSNIPHMLPYILLAAAVGVAVYGVVKLIQFIISKLKNKYDEDRGISFFKEDK